MDYRIENKYLVSDQDLAVLQGRLQHIMRTDIHQTDGCYRIRSLYYDDAWNCCLEENEAGIDQRQKFRIRIYNSQSDVIHLEIKEKSRGLTKKVSCSLSRQEAEDMIQNKLTIHPDSRKALNLLKLKSRDSLMRPKAIIEYERTAFVYPAGNVRITFDRNIMASSFCGDFFQESVPGMTPVLPTGMHVLEVKYDEFLPDAIAGALELGNLRRTAFSKYYLGRLALDGEFFD